MKNGIEIREVGPRDGLQNESKPFSTAAKVQLVDQLVASGLKYVEVSAFVSPKAIPKLSDAAEVFSQIQRAKGVTFAALVPNGKGMDRAIESGVDEVAVFTAASETFNQRNINASIEESFERFKPVIARARREKIPVRGYVSTAFFCPYEGEIEPKNVLPVIERLLDEGCHEVSVGDTIGRATPGHVERLLAHLLKKVPSEKLAGHFHDTYRQALANIHQAYQMGIRVFDTSVGGLGGCPYAPGARGNVATEEVIFMFEGMGLNTGVDLNLLHVAARDLEKHLGRKIPSSFFEAFSSAGAE